MTEGQAKTIEVCFTPALFGLYRHPDSVVVVADILRATTAMCTAFEFGVKEIIPVATVDEAYEYKKKGFLIAGERDGIVLPGADFGNSPFYYQTERVKGQSIVLTTTNGTQAIEMASGCSHVAIGSFLNLSALCEWIGRQGRNVVVLCAGWKNRFNLEDSVYAGAVTDSLIKHFGYTTQCDSAMASQDLWLLSNDNLMQYIDKSSHRHRLRKLMIDDVIEYCLTPDINTVVPVLRDGKLVLSDD